MTIAPSPRVRLVVVAALSLALSGRSSTQAPTSADGPWSGQMQCVLSVRGPNYQDDQTHTWRIIPGQPVLNGVFRQWPAVWSAQGGGSRMLPTGASETWKIAVPETNAPLAFSVNVATGQIRIGSQHGLLNINGAISGSSDGSRAPIVSALQEWPFPIIDDAATAATISGTRTRTVPAANGWRPPAGVPTTETCTWRFDKVAATNAPQSQSSSATGTTTNSGGTLRSAGAGTIQSTATDTTSNTDFRRERSAPSAGTIAAINAAQITVAYPNGGESLKVGDQIYIRWTHLLAPGTVFTADVSYDGGTTWAPTNANPLSGTLAWTVSASAATRARIRVRTADGSIADQSDADFTITPRTLAEVIASCNLAGPQNFLSYATPIGAQLRWNRVSGATGYTVARTDLGELPPAPLSAATTGYWHAALLESTYSYYLVAQYDQGCGKTQVTISPNFGSTPNLSFLTNGLPAGSVKLSWAVMFPSSDMANMSGLHIEGAGLRVGGVDSPGMRVDNRVQGSVDLGNVGSGVRYWNVTKYWITNQGRITHDPMPVSFQVP